MFEPWLGDRYGERSNAFGGLRVMVLGESHHHSDPRLIGTSVPGMTAGVVQKYAIDGSHIFFTNLTQVLQDRRKGELSQAELQALWNSVLFYNYVPVVVAEGPRIRPTEAMFGAGAKHLQDLLETHRPDVMLVCGYELWGHMVRGLPAAMQAEPYNDRPHDAALDHGTRRVRDVLALRMLHPTAGFSSKRWRPVVARALDPASAARRDGRTADGPPANFNSMRTKKYASQIAAAPPST